MGGPLPDDYDVECGWCRFGRVTQENRCWVPVPKKNVVHQTCASGKREIDREGFFCQWPCALAFCFHRVGMRRYMDQVRLEAGRQGHIGLLPRAPDPLRTLRRCMPNLKESEEESEAQFTQYIRDNVQVLERRHSEISSARVHKLHKTSARREGVHVLELSSAEAPDLREPVAGTETVTEGTPSERMGAYEQYHNAKGRDETKPKAGRKAAASTSAKPGQTGPRKATSGGARKPSTTRKMKFRSLF